MTANPRGSTPDEQLALFVLSVPPFVPAQLPATYEPAEPAEPTEAIITETMRLMLDEDPTYDPWGQISDLVHCALDLGYSDGEIQWLAPQSKAYQAWEVRGIKLREPKYDITRMLAKLRLDRDDLGRPGDAADSSETSQP